MTTMMSAPAGAEPDAVTLQIPAIPMTWEQASIMLDATFDAWRMLSGEIDAARGDDWQWIQEILALPAHTRYIKARATRPWCAPPRCARHGPADGMICCAHACRTSSTRSSPTNGRSAPWTPACSRACPRPPCATGCGNATTRPG